MTTIEAAIAAVWSEAGHRILCGKDVADDDHSQGRRGSPGDRDDCDCDVGEKFDALDASITAHVESEVARRLAARDDSDRGSL